MIKVQKYRNLGINAVNKCKNNLDLKEGRDVIELDFGPAPNILKEDNLDVIELDFGPAPNILKEDNLDVYKGIQSEIVNTTIFDENSDLSTTYLGKSDRPKINKIKAEEYFSISEQGYMLGQLLDGTVNLSCLNLITIAVNHSILYQNLPQKHREFR